MKKFTCFLSSALLLGSFAEVAQASVVAWGSNIYGESTVPSGLGGVSAISANAGDSAALKSDGTVVVWGENNYGQANVPSGLANVVAIAAAPLHELALKNNGTVVAWGFNDYGQSTVPAGLNNVVAVAGGLYHSLALKSDGTVTAWGGGSYGQTHVPTGLANVVKIASGWYHNLALKNDGTVVAWGLNANGQTTVPAGLSGVVAVAAGVGHSLALKSDGTVVAWGSNVYGESTVPTGLNNVIAIAAGGTDSMALKSDGTVVVWGENNYNQTTVPTGLNNVVGIACGVFQCLALENSGTITTVAGVGGSGNYGFAGDGGPATSATLYGPGAVEPDAFGNFYIADTYNQVVREVDTTGTINTVAGNNSLGAGYSGDGSAATSAQLFNPMTIFLMGNDLWIADIGNSVIRTVDFSSGNISTVAGDYSLGAGYSGDGGPATGAALNQASATAVDASGNLYIADLYNNLVRKVDTSGTITTVAGNYSLGAGYSGDGGPATSAALNFPTGVAVDGVGNLYITDTGNNVIRKVDTSGTITTYAGNQSLGGSYSGDGGPATSAGLNYPQGESLDAAGNLYFADSANGVVRKVDVNGVITTVAGQASLNGGYSGDGGYATAAAFNWPAFVSVDNSGNLYIADCYNNAIRKVSY